MCTAGSRNTQCDPRHVARRPPFQLFVAQKYLFTSVVDSRSDCESVGDSRGAECSNSARIGLTRHGGTHARNPSSAGQSTNSHNRPKYDTVNRFVSVPFAVNMGLMTFAAMAKVPGERIHRRRDMSAGLSRSRMSHGCHSAGSAPTSSCFVYSAAFLASENAVSSPFSLSDTSSLSL